MTKKTKGGKKQMRNHPKIKKMCFFTLSMPIIFVISWIFKFNPLYLFVPVILGMIISYIKSKKEKVIQKDRYNKFQSYLKQSQGDYHEWLNDSG